MAGWAGGRLTYTGLGERKLLMSSTERSTLIPPGPTGARGSALRSVARRVESWSAAAVGGTGEPEVGYSWVINYIEWRGMFCHTWTEAVKRGV